VVKQYRGDEDGYYSIDVISGNIMGPLEEETITGYLVRHKIDLKDPKILFE
jgi:hypothetical protein